MMKKILIFSTLVLSLLPLIAVYHKIGGCATPLDVQSLVVENGIAYLAEGFLLHMNTTNAIFQTLDVSDPLNPFPLDIYTLPFQYYFNHLQVDIENETAYLAQDNVLKVVDVSAPADLTYINSLSGHACDVCVVDTILYKAADTDGLKIYDVSDPQNIVLLGSLVNPGYCDCVTVAGDLAFVGFNSYPYMGLQVIDVSDPYNPVLLGSLTGFSPESIAVSGTLALVASGGLYIIDTYYPEFPIMLSHFYSAPQNAVSVTIADSIAYLACYRWSTDVFDGSMKAIDFSAPQNPFLVSTYASAGAVFDVQIGGDIAYLAGSDGLQCVDISQPQNPALVASLDTLYAQSFVFAGDLAYVAGWGDLEIVDVSTPQNPVMVGFCDTQESANNIAVVDNIAYVSGTQLHLALPVHLACVLELIDVTDPQNPTSLSTYEIGNQNNGDPPAGCVAVSAETAYIAYGSSLKVIDVSDPQNPTSCSDYTAPGDIRSITVADSIAYVSTSADLQILDISVPQSPSLLGSYGFPADYVSLSGNLACVAVGNSGLHILDVSDPATPVLVSSIPPQHATSYIDRCLIRDDMLYISDNDWNEICVYDISVPQSPVLLTRYDWNLSTSDMWTDGDLLYTANGAYGLNIHDLTLVDVDDPVQIPPSAFQMSNYPNPFNPETTLSYILPSAGMVSLMIYNSRGQLVRSLLNEEQSAGEHSLIWNGKDDFGNSVASGLYLCRIASNGKHETRKMLLLK
jgi:hypothetical protein